MASSGSDGSRKRPRAESETEDESLPTKRAASMEKGLNDVDETVVNGDADIDAYMLEQDGPNGYQAPNGLDSLPQPGPPPIMTRVQTVPTREKWDAIGKLKYTSLKEGDTWYLISHSWMEKWRRLCTPNQYKVDDSTLGTVDNSDIVDEHGALLPKLREETHYEILCKEAWDMFVDWYGQPNHVLPRKIISEGVHKMKRVDVYPLKIFVFRMSAMTPASSNKTTPIVEISKSATVEELINQVVEISTLDRSDLRYWQVIGTVLEDRPLEGIFYPSDRISDDNTQPFPDASYVGKRLDEALVESGDAIVYEYCSQGTWTVDMTTLNISKGVPRVAPATTATVPTFFSPQSEEFKAKYGSGTHNAIKPLSPGAGFTPSSSHSTALTSFQGSASTTTPFSNGRVTSYTASSRSPGTVGLNNLGNTCFMNSALQCLAHEPELNEYFLTGVYRDELNPTNPLGMKGAIAEVFGSLLDKLWHPISYAFAPREFKQQLQRFAPQFSGYAQHDTQEFLAFLLDGLHEDLNRVLKKPYVEIPDWEGQGDKELVKHALTAWEGYKKRNDSVIVDLFQGQYKSTLVCPECEKVSITFDPFMYLTLPLPVQRSWEHTIHWVPYAIEKPHLKIPVQLSRDGNIKDLKLLMKKWMGTPVENQICIEAFSHKIYKDFDDHSPLGEIAERDLIVVYELPCPAQANPKSEELPAFIPVAVYHAAAGSRTYSHDLFGIPFYIAIPFNEARDENAIYGRLVERYAPWTAQADQLYKRRVELGESSNTSSTSEPGEATEKDELEEQDVTEMRADVKEDVDMLPKSRDPSEIGEEVITNLGPQENLFNIKIYPPSRAGGYSYSAHLFNDPLRGTPETLAERAQAPKKKKFGITTGWSRSTTPEPDSQAAAKPLITSEDTILCEWEPNLLEFFFAINTKSYKKDESSLWEKWETFEHPDYIAASKARKATKERGITLEDCLDEFTKEERLGEDDLWYCPRCKKHQQATKKFELWKVPDILVVHLKRFSNSRMLRDKIDAFVDFPIDGLDLSQRVEERLIVKKWEDAGNNADELGIDKSSSNEPLLYDLFAVDEHLGGLGGGHYRAYAKNFKDDTWYHFDDTHVSASKARDSVNPNAYLLFYRRRSDKPLGGATQEKVAAYREKLESKELNGTDAESAQGLDGAAASASTQSLDPEA